MFFPDRARRTFFYLPNLWEQTVFGGHMPIEKSKTTWTGFALRASVASRCNMACVYCPQPTQEDLTPDRFRNRGLSHEDYLVILRNLLEVVSFEKISFTGGEPLLNHRLHEILHEVRPRISQLELNTNGVLLTPQRWKEIAPYLDQVKISIDTIDPHEFQRITKFKTADGLTKVLAAIETVRDSGVELVLNGVVMKSNLERIFDLIEFVAAHRLRLHLLDFNYTEQCREVWEKEFVPNELLMKMLSEKFGASFEVPRFGCGYFEYYPAEDAVVRVRTSFSGSMRSARCGGCPYYCQTGIFGLRLSSDGWVTYCYSTAEIDGVLLEPTMSQTEVRRAVEKLVSDVTSAKHVDDSFIVMLDRLKLNPINVEGISTIDRHVPS
jgi:molybdenum cofactor biosynthesis enzyme MoaA